MKQVNIHEAKTHFSKLAAAAEAGEEVVIARNGRPFLKLVRIESPAAGPDPRWPNRRFGALKGKLVLDEDWDSPRARAEMFAPMYGMTTEEYLREDERLRLALEKGASS